MGAKVEKLSKKCRKKFGGNQKVRIFAARLRKNGYSKFIEKVGRKSTSKKVPRKRRA